VFSQQITPCDIGNYTREAIPMAAAREACRAMCNFDFMTNLFICKAKLFSIVMRVDS